MTKRSTIILMVIFGLIAIISAILLFSAIANSPSQAPKISTVTSVPSRNSLDMSPVLITNAFVSFEYPKLMMPTPTSLVSGEIAAYTFLHRDIETWNLAVEVQPVTGGSVTYNSAYEFRKDDPSTYRETTYSEHGQTVDVMTDTTYGGFSKVAFLVHGPYQATISLYGDDQNGEGALQATFNMIIDSWQWHQ